MVRTLLSIIGVFMGLMINAINVQAEVGVE